MSRFPRGVTRIMGALPVLAAGILLGQCTASAPAYADRVVVECHPVIKREVRCGNPLATYFETKGVIPNRCKVS